MGIFDLPPEDKRLPIGMLLKFQKHIKPEQLKAPDYYIIYRVGVIAQIQAYILCGAAYVIVYLHHYYDFAPSLDNLTEFKGMLGIYNVFLNYIGWLMIPTLVYYSVLFYRNVDFKKYNIARYSAGGTTQGFSMWSTILMPLVTLLALLNVGTSLNLLYSYNMFKQSADSPAFVFFIFVSAAFALGLIMQVVFSIFWISAYTIYERKELRKRKKRDK